MASNTTIGGAALAIVAAAVVAIVGSSQEPWWWCKFATCAAPAAAPTAAADDGSDSADEASPGRPAPAVATPSGTVGPPPVRRWKQGEGPGQAVVIQPPPPVRDAARH